MSAYITNVAFVILSICTFLWMCWRGRPLSGDRDRRKKDQIDGYSIDTVDCIILIILNSIMFLMPLILILFRITTFQRVCIPVFIFLMIALIVNNMRKMKRVYFVDGVLILDEKNKVRSSMEDIRVLKYIETKKKTKMIVRNLEGDEFSLVLPYSREEMEYYFGDLELYRVWDSYLRNPTNHENYQTGFLGELIYLFISLFIVLLAMPAFITFVGLDSIDALPVGHETQQYVYDKPQSPNSYPYYVFQDEKGRIYAVFDGQGNVNVYDSEYNFCYAYNLKGNNRHTSCMTVGDTVYIEANDHIYKFKGTEFIEMKEDTEEIDGYGGLDFLEFEESLDENDMIELYAPVCSWNIGLFSDFFEIILVVTVGLAVLGSVIRFLLF